MIITVVVSDMGLVVGAYKSQETVDLVVRALNRAEISAVTTEIEVE